MSDLVNRLRESSQNAANSFRHFATLPAPTLDEAAARIEALERENEQLRVDLNLADAAKHLPAALSGTTPPDGHTGWQTIDSAPKDGTPVVVGRVMDGWGLVRGLARWEDIHGISGWVTFAAFSDPPGVLGLGHPTHWHPLTAHRGDKTQES